MLLAGIKRPPESDVTDITTPTSVLRIRLKRLPTPGEFDEFDLDRFRVGETDVIPARMASLLILAGCADLVDSHPARVEAADFSHPPRVPKRL